MNSSGKLSSDEVRQIGLRVKSVRVLSGLNQEEFALKHGIGHMSLKSWEMGRATPRRDGMFHFLEAIKNEGICVEPSWIYHGTGLGPTYFSTIQRVNKKIESTYIESQIDLFTKEKISKGHNPVIVTVDDESMIPEYKPGQIIGGIFTTIENIKNKFSDEFILGIPWLVFINDGTLAPRRLYFSGDNLFFKANNKSDLVPYFSSSIAQICWNYLDFENT